MIILAYVGLGLGVLTYIVSALSKRVLCRCIPCASLQIPAVVTRVLSLFAQIIAVWAATMIVVN